MRSQHRGNRLPRSDIDQSCMVLVGSTGSWKQSAHEPRNQSNTRLLCRGDKAYAANTECKRTRVPTFQRTQGWCSLTRRAGPCHRRDPLCRERGGVAQHWECLTRRPGSWRRKSHRLPKKNQSVFALKLKQSLVRLANNKQGYSTCFRLSDLHLQDLAKWNPRSQCDAMAP